MSAQTLLALLGTAGQVVAQGFQMELFGDLFHGEAGAPAGQEEECLRLVYFDIDIGAVPGAHSGELVLIVIQEKSSGACLTPLASPAPEQAQISGKQMKSGLSLATRKTISRSGARLTPCPR
jgi:hypothetical protein